LKKPFSLLIEFLFKQITRLLLAFAEEFVILFLFRLPLRQFLFSRETTLQKKERNSNNENPMLDMRLLRKNPQEIESRLKTKDPTVHLAPLMELDEEIRSLKVQTEELKNRRNTLSKEIGEAKRQGKETTTQMQEVVNLGDEIAEFDQKLREKEELLHLKLGELPNLAMEGVKIALDPKENVCLREVGQKPQFAFPAKNHVELNESLQLFDFKRAAKIAGSHWPTYCGMGARLEWALLNYMIDIHLENGFLFWLPPLLVRPEIAYGSAQLPKFENQLRMRIINST
jgi:seryl-tRNA synthetase